jgi:hypothetical protein
MAKLKRLREECANRWAWTDEIEFTSVLMALALCLALVAAAVWFLRTLPQ